MPGRQAKALSRRELNAALAAVRHRVTADRDRVIILLSVMAGLRACEIAGLQWPMVLDARGKVTSLLELDDAIAKKRSGRRIPLHPELKAALTTLRRSEEATTGPVIRSGRGGHMQANSIVNWFVLLYRETGAQGCSSHSGRRTFITRAARQAHKAGASLRDVQMLAGHRSIETTQGYIDGDSDAQRRLVARL